MCEIISSELTRDDHGEMLRGAKSSQCGHFRCGHTSDLSNDVRRETLRQNVVQNAPAPGKARSFKNRPWHLHSTTVHLYLHVYNVPVGARTGQHIHTYIVYAGPRQVFDIMLFYTPTPQKLYTQQRIR